MSASAAETFSAWLEAFNDSDPAALETFAAERSDVAPGRVPGRGIGASPAP